MNEVLEKLAWKLTRRRELLGTSASVPFAIYFVAFTSGLSSSQLRVFLAFAALVVVSSFLAGHAHVRSRVDRLRALIADGSPDSLRQAKVSLVQIPRADALVVSLRWLVGAPVVCLGTWAFAGMSGLQAAAIASTPIMIGVEAVLLAYLLSEKAEELAAMVTAFKLEKAGPAGRRPSGAPMSPTPAPRRNGIPMNGHGPGADAFSTDDDVGSTRDF